MPPNNPDSAIQPKSPIIAANEHRENISVTQIGPNTPVNDICIIQDVMDKSMSPNLPVKIDGAKKQTSPNLTVKKPMEEKTLTHDEDNKLKPTVEADVPRSPKPSSNVPRSPRPSSNVPRSPRPSSNVPRSPRPPRTVPSSPKSSSNVPRSPRPSSNVSRSPRPPSNVSRSPKPPSNVSRSPKPPSRTQTPSPAPSNEPPKDPKNPGANQDPWTFMKVLLTFAMGTSNHGFANSRRLWLAGYKYCSMALLSVALFLPIIGFLFGFIGVRDMLQPDYFSTQIKVINDKQTGLALPRIIMSNSGLFNYTALKELNVSRYEVSLITTLLLGEVAHTDTLENNIEQVNKDYHSLLNRLNTTAWGVWNLLSYKCHEVIIDCLYSNKHIPGPTCCKEHFDTILGNFGLSFITKTSFVQEREEVAAGLTFSLRVPIHPLDLDWNYMNSDAILLKTGLRVSIVDSSKDFSAGFSSTTPVAGLDRIIVTLAYDQHDNTGMYQSLFPWLDATADCTPDDAPFREQASVGDSCMASSLHVCGQQLRNCNVVSYPFWNGKDRFCDFKDQVALIHSKAAVKCRFDYVDTCGHLCQENIYRFSVQSCPLMEFSDIPDTGNNSRWSVEGAFTMFYTHLSHTLITKSRANLVNVLSSLGGTMSLFMGASILNLGEQTTVISGIIIYTVASIRRKVKAFRKRRLIAEGGQMAGPSS